MEPLGEEMSSAPTIKLGGAPKVGLFYRLWVIVAGEQVTIHLTKATGTGFHTTWSRALDPDLGREGQIRGLVQEALCQLDDFLHDPWDFHIGQLVAVGRGANELLPKLSAYLYRVLAARRAPSASQGTLDESSAGFTLLHHINVTIGKRR